MLEVGLGAEYRFPSEAAKVAKDGDIIRIRAGQYVDDYVHFTQSQLLIQGEDGVRVAKGSKSIRNGKALWIIDGKDVVVRNITFENAAVADRNGAGIRLQGGNLTIEGCEFRHNEMGILTSDGTGIDLTIRRSLFFDNRQNQPKRPPYSHNIYVGRIGRFELTDSEVYGAETGHNVKSRARESVLLNNRIYDTPDGPSSYLVDLSNGGRARLEGNLLIQGAGATNPVMVAFGAEGELWSENSLLMQDNILVSEKLLSVGVMSHVVDAPITLRNNSFDSVPLKLLDARKTGMLKDLKHRVARLLDRIR